MISEINLCENYYYLFFYEFKNKFILYSRENTLEVELLLPVSIKFDVFLSVLDD